MEAPQISIVMPVYNASLYLTDSIGSILTQTYSDFELIIVDDGSIDNSLAIIKGYKDHRIRIFENNHDYIQSLNLGMSKAIGKYIARMDADDIMEPYRLQAQYEFMENNPVIDICGGWVQTFGEDNRIIKTALNHNDILCQAIAGSPLCHPTVMMKQELVRSFPLKNNIYQVYNEEYIYAEDYDCWTQLIRKGYRFANIPKILLRYRLSPHQVTSKKTKEMTERTNKIQNEYLKYVMESIINKKPSFYAILNEAMELVNSHDLSLFELRQIVYLIYVKVLRI